jgi:hypothetical protein
MTHVRNLDTKISLLNKDLDVVGDKNTTSVMTN